MIMAKVHEGNLLKQAAKLSQQGSAGLARGLNMSRTHLYRLYEQEDLDPAIKQRAAEILGTPVTELFTATGVRLHENAREIGSATGELSSNRNNHFLKLGKDKYLMFTKLVNHKARAGYLAGWGDDEYIESLPVHAIIVNELHKGIYRSFEVTDDSADDGSKHSICEDDIVTGRQLSRNHWRSKFHNHQYPYWIIIHRVEGILVKMIGEHNTENGTILCVSRNPNKKKYPDLLLHLDDISEIYNVVQVTKSGKNL